MTSTTNRTTSKASIATRIPAQKPAAPDVARHRSGLSLVRVNNDLWRATLADGRIVGHIERRDGVDGTEYVAKRLSPGQARFHTLGEFWRMDDAMDCLHAL